tara:strand:+ start:34 stop:1917 length:1884 start_codon:yes stop_codon:yes gene_type:complete
MAQNNITIHFKGRGHKALKAAIKGLADEQDRLIGKTKEVGKEEQRTNKKTRLLNNAFATMRSKLLLASFAMALFVRPLMQFARQAAKVESMAMAFNTLSGGTVRASNAISELGIAVNGTMNKFDLFKQANNAMILGVTRNASEMAEMFDMAQRLGRALGQDAASSVESLITGIGRQSRLMLDNIGIIVKADRAYKDYALSIKANVQDLSDAQKKQAFLNATLTAARQKVAGLPPEVLTAEESFQRFTATVDDLKVSLGDSFKGVMAGAMDVFSDFVMLNKEADMEALSLSTNTEALALGLRKAKSELEKLKGGYVGFAVPSEAFNEEIERAEKNVKMLSERLNRFQQPTPLDPKLVDFSLPFSPEDPSFDEQALNNRLKREAEMNILLLQQQSLKDGLVSVEERRDIINQRLIEAQNLESAGIITQNELIKAEIQNKKELIALEEIEQKKKSDSIKLAGKSIQTVAALTGMNRRNAQLTAKIQAIAAGVNAFAAAQDAFAAAAKNPLTITNPLYPKIVYGLTLAQGLAGAVAAHNAASKFETGGLVGGRRHSQGGTMIEAEQGEFVMSRNAVQAVGIEAMNRINQGGSAGNVTINVTGNVMSQDYVEGELANQLREAIRRGADIGVS